jgi:DNA-directed RNA polymerase sigma subunit (sigma70/sigma32)
MNKETSKTTTKTTKEQQPKERKRKANRILTLTPKREKELLKAANGPDGEKKRRAIRDLIFYNQNLVKYIARGCSSTSKDIDTQELASEGNISLLKAIKNFNLNSQNRFATYAGY